MLSAGRLRSRVTIRRPVEVDNGLGGSTTTWTSIAEDLPAEVIGLTGGEVVRDQALQNVAVYRVTIRWCDDVLTSDQLHIGAIATNIHSAVDPDGRREQLVILADTAGVRAD